MKPKDVRDKGISERELKRQKAKIRNGKQLNPKVKRDFTPIQFLLNTDCPFPMLF